MGQESGLLLRRVGGSTRLAEKMYRKDVSSPVSPSKRDREDVYPDRVQCVTPAHSFSWPDETRTRSGPPTLQPLTPVSPLLSSRSRSPVLSLDLAP